MELSVRLSKQSLMDGIFLVLPTYFLCGQYIVIAAILLAVNTFEISASSNLLNVYLNFFFDLVMTFFVLFIFRRELKEHIENLVDTPIHILIYEIVIGFGGVYLLNILGGLLSAYLSGSANSNSVNQTTIEEMMETLPALSIISSVVLAPILEEIIFRLLIFTGIYPKSRILAYIVSAGIFGFVHVSSTVLAGDLSEMIMIFPYLFVGFALCFIYERNDTICAPIICHALMNLISVILMFI